MRNFTRGKIGFSVLGLSILALGAIFAFGGSRDSGHRGFEKGGFPPPFLFEKIAKELGLNDEQKTQAKTILESRKEVVKPLIELMKQNHENSKNLGTDGTFDEVQVIQIANEQAETMKKLFVEKERTKAELFAILTPEQREKAKEMQAKFGEKMKGKFGRGFGGFGEKPVPTE